jgi:hypothetical protein
LAKDISRTGIFFVVPAAIHADEPVHLELAIPDEITHRGELRIQLEAQPVRQDEMGDAERAPAPGTAVAAALNAPDGEMPVPLPSRSR